MRIMSDFREAMWGVVQQGLSTLDIDYVAYADKHFDRLSRDDGRRAVRRAGSATPRRSTVLRWAERPSARRDRRRRCRRSEHRLPPHASSGGHDVLLVDRSELTSGSTFHSAGLVGAAAELGRPHPDDDVRRRAVPDGSLAETGVDPGWHEVGTLHLASSPYRLRGARAGRLGGRRRSGCPLEIVSAAAAHDRFPLIDAVGRARRGVRADRRAPGPHGAHDRVRGGRAAPGCADPHGHPRRGIPVRDGRVSGVRDRTHGADRGRGRRERRRDLGERARPDGRRRDPRRPDGASVPASRGRSTGSRSDFPTLRDPDHLVYVARGGRRARVGGYERNPDPWHVDTPIPPATSTTGCCAEEWERFEPIAEGAFGLIPALQTTEVNRFINGPEAFTPDDDFILGETEVRGFFVAAGFCAHGITGAAGVGRWTAEWIVEGEPSMDLSKMDVRRFGAHYRSRGYALARAVEIYSTHYDVKYPGEECQAGRPLQGVADLRAARRRSAPSSARRRAGSARTGSRSNEDRALRGVPPAWMGGRALVDRDRGRARRRRASARACSTRRASRRSRCRVRARVAFLQRVCANDVDRARGHRGLHADAEPPRRASRPTSP